MAAPFISWYQSDNTTRVTEWNLGTVDAGTVSNDTVFLIWNNREGETLVSDMTNCTITTKDEDGVNTGELVLNKWIEVKVDTLNENTFTPIGGNTTKAIKGGGSTAAGVISGAINDGKLTAVDNFAKVTLHANVPAVAIAGATKFLTRVSYQYQ